MAAAGPRRPPFRPRAADFEGTESEPSAALLPVPMRFAPNPQGGTGFSATAARRLN